ncbi:sigma factor [Streptomyces sp. NPDC055722]
MSTVPLPLPMPDATEDGGRFTREALVYLDRLYAAALQMTSDQAAAEDLVQGTFERAFRNFGQINPGAAVRLWLYRDLVNAWFDTPTRPSVSASAPVDHPTHHAMNLLAPTVRITVHLADVADFSEQEIADITGVPRGIVVSRLRRGHSQLAEQLAAWLRQSGQTQEA